MGVHDPIASSSLPESLQSALIQSDYTTFADLLITPLHELSRKCTIPHQDARAIYSTLLRAQDKIPLPSLDALDAPWDELISTGDAFLDYGLGGGIRTGMVWEVVGESAAGKSQLALQLSLFAQNPRSVGGVSGTTCFLSTSAQLPTKRLAQILESNETLDKRACTLDNVQTLRISTTAMLLNILTNLLPNFIQQKASSSHPVKLVIIDALTELFHMPSSEKPTTAALIDRGKDLNQLASTLHVLAAKHNIAVVVINEVIDRFDRGQSTDIGKADVVYNDQSRLFGSANSVPGENTKEASLGLVWANSINARIMMSRTGRRRYLDAGELQQQQKKTRPVTGHIPSSSSMHTAENEDSQATLIRRLSIIFSSVSPPSSLDYIVTKKGVSVLPDASQPRSGVMEYGFSDESEVAHEEISEDEDEELDEAAERALAREHMEAIIRATQAELARPPQPPLSESLRTMPAGLGEAYDYLLDEEGEDDQSRELYEYELEAHGISL